MLTNSKTGRLLKHDSEQQTGKEDNDEHVDQEANGRELMKK